MGIYDESLDARGLLCPMPIVKLAKQMRELSMGNVLELLADDVGAQKDIPEWCTRTGNEYLGMEDETTCTKFYIKKMR